MQSRFGGFNEGDVENLDALAAAMIDRIESIPASAAGLETQAPRVEKRRIGRPRTIWKGRPVVSDLAG
jgi:hypothetical protein